MGDTNFNILYHIILCLVMLRSIVWEMVLGSWSFEYRANHRLRAIKDKQRKRNK